MFSKYWSVVLDKGSQKDYHLTISPLSLRAFEAKNILPNPGDKIDKSGY